ncbi:MAG: adenine deaminase C-terminal domain-containing protein [Candidatus Methylomirabilales bacterium]
MVTARRRPGRRHGRSLNKVWDLGSTAANPFAALSFLALPVIPEVRLTYRGPVDVGKGDFVSLMVG